MVDLYFGVTLERSTFQASFNLCMIVSVTLPQWSGHFWISISGTSHFLHLISHLHWDHKSGYRFALSDFWYSAVQISGVQPLYHFIMHGPELFSNCTHYSCWRHQPSDTSFLALVSICQTQAQSVAWLLLINPSTVSPSGLCRCCFHLLDLHAWLERS